MMKFFITALLIFTFPETAFLQKAKLDSLEKLIRVASTDTARINLINTKNFIIGRFNLDSAINLNKKTIDQSISIHYRYGEASARSNLAVNYCTKGMYAAAAENLSICRDIFLSLKDSLGLCMTFSNYGMMYGMQSKYDTSIQYIEKAIAVAERNHFNERLPTYYSNIAVGYQMQSNFSVALRYLQKALALAKSENNILNQAYTNLNIGITYENLKDTARAMQFYLESIRNAKAESLKNVELYAYSNLAALYSRKAEAGKAYDYAMKSALLAKQTGDVGMQATGLIRAADALALMNKFTEAEVVAKQSIRMADSSGQDFNRYQVNAAMGEILKKQEKYQEALPFLEKSVAILAKTDLYVEEVGITYSNLSLCYEKMGNFSKALSFFKTAAQIADSVHSRDNIRKATELSMNYEFNQKQEAQRIEQENKDVVTGARQLALIIGLVLTCLLAIVAFSAYRNKQKANAQLQQQTEELQKALNRLKETQGQLIQSEKMASLGELTAGIAHEIQNPLNFVNNFSEVSLELAGEMEHELKSDNPEEAIAIAADIQQNLTKIHHHGKRADGIVKSMLQHSRASTGEKQLVDMNVLAEEFLKLSYHGLRAKNKAFNATLINRFDEHLPKVNMVQQDIGRVLLNLFNNAFYAVLQKKKNTDLSYKPEVTVSTSTGKNTISITVKDNGTGIPDSMKDKIMQPFFTTKPTGEGTGLGLSISYDIIVKGHGGTIQVESKEGEYSAFTIVLPLPSSALQQ